MRDYHSQFISNSFYHVYNRGNNRETIFRESKNYDFFLSRWNKYMQNHVETWAFCLMPNHFHFLIKVKNEQRLPKFQKLGKSDSEILSIQFRNFFISYSKSYNKVYSRTGSLFQKPFKRIKIDSDEYLLTLIHYIHHNPIHHGFVKDYIDWKYSSYSAIIGKEKTHVNRHAVLNLFGSKELFLDFHRQQKNYKKINHLIIE